MAIVFFRTLIIFLTLIILMRLLGKRQLRELELSELVVSVMIADLGATPLQDMGIPLFYGLIPIVTLFACELSFSGLGLSSVFFRKLMYGTPSFLIINGNIQEREMRRVRMSIDELLEELRGKEILDINTVQYAILETDGTLNTVLMPQERPPSMSQLGLTPEDCGYPVLLIEDGVLLENNLKHIGRDRNWLKKQLDARKAGAVEDVFIMIFYDSGKIYFSLKDKRK